MGQPVKQFLRVRCQGLFPDIQSAAGQAMSPMKLRKRRSMMARVRLPDIALSMRAMNDSYALFKAIKEDTIIAFRQELIHHTFLGMGDDEGFTVLHRAAQHINHEFAEALLKKGADVMARARWNWTPLHEAANCGNFKTAAVLLRYGAKTETFSDWAESPLIVALISRKINIIKLLLSHKANPVEKDKMGRNALHILTRKLRKPLWREEKLLYLFLEQGVRVDSCFRGLTPLQHTMNNKIYNLVKGLLQHGSNPNVFNDNGLTPLHQAVLDKQYELVEILLEKGAKVNVLSKGSTGWSPIHHAVCLEDKKLCKILLYYGADVTLKDSLGQTACDINKNILDKQLEMMKLSTTPEKNQV